MTSVQVDSIDELKLENVGFAYEGSQAVFTDLTLDVPMGKNILVTGSAGSGHSTLLKILVALVQPQTGHYYINGHDTTQMSFEEFLPFRRKIGYTFDYGGLFANRTLIDNLTLPLLYHKICAFDEAYAQARQMIEHFGFTRQAVQRPAAVSGGLRKLVCLLRTFILKPEMLVMDDPFTGVDPESARKVIAMIQQKREAGELRHVFFTSRDEVWSERLGFEALYIENGKSRSEGKAA